MFTTIAQWIALVVLTISLIYTITRNSGADKTKRTDTRDVRIDAEIKSAVEGIEKRLDDPTFGLGAIVAVMNKQCLHCTRVSTALEGRLNLTDAHVHALQEQHTPLHRHNREIKP